MDKADSSKVFRDEVHPPPRCCCSKSLKSKFLSLIIDMNLFQAANAWDAKKTFIAKNEVAALSCNNGKDDLADGQEVSKKILANENHQIFSYFIPRLPLRHPTSPRTTPTRPSATGRSRCLPTRRCTSGARPLTSSGKTSSG